MIGRATMVGLALVLVAGCGGSSSTPPMMGPGQEPTIDTTLVATLQVLEENRPYTFDVTATDPQGDMVELRLLNPPAGATFPRVSAAGSVTGTFDWTPRVVRERRPRLEFRATDINGNVSVRVIQLYFQGRVVESAQHCCDVTGDGIRDNIVRASAADINAVDSGAIYVFAGAATPAVAPTATLSIPAPVAMDFLGANLIVCCDVTGDGIDDVLAAAVLADFGGVDTGVVYLFEGGAGMTGNVAPTATLRIAAPTINDLFGQVLECCDVTGDGINDVIAGSDTVDTGGVANAGRYLVWQGGPTLTGIAAPLATLARPTPAPSDNMGSGGVYCCEVTGDGVADIVIVSPSADTVANADAGAIDVFAGGATLTGTVAPTASLEGAMPNDALGISDVRCCDVTGDATLDIVVASVTLDLGGVTDAGGILVWAGGAGLTGTPAPTATLMRPVPVMNDNLAPAFGGWCCCEVTGDTRMDIVAAAPRADVGGTADAGEALVWAGSAGLAGVAAPTATLRIPGATAGDALGQAGVIFAKVTCCDVTGDGVNDVVLPASNFDNAVVDEGAVFVWRGGATLVATPPPLARLERTAPVVSDQLGESFQVLHCCDVTGDATRDVIVGARFADVGGVVNAGEVVVYAGGAALTGNLAPTAILRRGTPVVNDNLGQTPLRCCDVTGDGRADLIVPAASADVGGTSNAGEVLVWHGGATLTGTAAATATLGPATQTANDFFGTFTDCCDVDDDGTLDVLISASSTDVAGVVDAGGVFFWRGETGLTGSPAPVALRRTAPVMMDGLTAWRQHPVVCCDLTGDGLVDVVTGGISIDVGGVANVGAVLLWRGGVIPAGTPDVEHAVSGATMGDSLGN